jgi:hypothetical protein
MRATLTAIRDKLYQRRHEPVPIVGKWLQRVLNGYFAYHAVPTNLLRLNGFRSEVCRAWRHALLRRSQRHRLNWCLASTILTGQRQLFLPIGDNYKLGVVLLLPYTGAGRSRG